MPIYLIESLREDRTVRHRAIDSLGHKDVQAETGELDRLVASIARDADAL